MAAEDRSSTTGQILLEETYLRRVAHSLARSSIDADDLVQDTMLHALRARARFRPGTSIRAWTTTIMRHVFITGALRARRRRPRNDTDCGEALERAAARQASPLRTDAGYASIAESLEDPVKRALDQVPGLYRTPLLMAAIGEFSCGEIARTLRIPKGTVLSRIHRARERLRAELHHVDARRYRRRWPSGAAPSQA